MKTKKREVGYNQLEDTILKQLQDPEVAAAFLVASFEEYEEDGRLDLLLDALNTYIKAKTSYSSFAKKIKMTQKKLAELLSGEEEPNLSVVRAIMHGLGFKLSLTPIMDGFND